MTKGKVPPQFLKNIKGKDGDAQPVDPKMPVGKTKKAAKKSKNSGKKTK